MVLPWVLLTTSFYWKMTGKTEKMAIQEEEDELPIFVEDNKKMSMKTPPLNDKKFVSPIKIKNIMLKNSVQLTSSPISIINTKKNLNSSLIETDEDDNNANTINYSIMESKDNDIKITLRKSQRINFENEKEEQTNRKRFYINNNNQSDVSPTKRNKQFSFDKNIEELSSSTQTIDTKLVVNLRRKSILKTPTTNKQNPNHEISKKRVQLVNIIDEQFNSKDNKSKLSERNARKKQNYSNNNNENKDLNTVVNKILPSSSSLSKSPSLASLPCRQNEFSNIYQFLKSKICEQTSGCMYISGVPGTGKTATVTAVINYLKYEASIQKLSKFNYVEINGMKLTEPRQAYIQIYKQLICKKNKDVENNNNYKKSISWENALSILEKTFNSISPNENIVKRKPTPSSHKKLSSSSTYSQKMTILLVDELDCLCNRRQDVIYNLLDWPTKINAKLIVITIANTMDLPERVLMGKVSSRLGLTRLTFLPYTYKQLQEIVTNSLLQSDSYKGDAIQFIARKVAAVSGDARRALDICKRAIEIYNNEKNKQILDMSHVQQALSEMISSTKIQALKNCSRIEKVFLQAIVAEITRTGIDEVIFNGVYSQMEAIANFIGVNIPSPGRTLQLSSKLGSQRLIICEHSKTGIHQKILLNVSKDDIFYAIKLDTL